MPAYPSVRVGGPGGVWLDSIGLWGDLTIEHQWPYGCWEVSWSMTSTARKRPPALVVNALVDVFLGARPIWAGKLTEPDWAGGQFVAQGSVRFGETVPALTSSTFTTSIPDVAIDNAVARGWLNWQRTTSISSAAFVSTDSTGADATDQINSVSALLDSYTLANGLRWGVDEYRRVYAQADPTVATWDIAPDTQTIGIASDKLVGTLVARWTDPNGKNQTSTYGSGLPVVFASFLSRGQLTAAQMNATAAQVLARTGQIVGATNSITVTRDQISSNGVHPSLGLVRAGQKVRLLGQRDPRGLDANTSMVLGRSVWTVTDGTIALDPVDASTRDLSTIISDLGGEIVS